jgi:hypothetical protein
MRLERDQAAETWPRTSVWVATRLPQGCVQTPSTGQVLDIRLGVVELRRVQAALRQLGEGLDRNSEETVRGARGRGSGDRGGARSPIEKVSEARKNNYIAKQPG